MSEYTPYPIGSIGNQNGLMVFRDQNGNTHPIRLTQLPTIEYIYPSLYHSGINAEYDVQNGTIRRLFHGGTWNLFSYYMQKFEEDRRKQKDNDFNYASNSKQQPRYNIQSESLASREEKKGQAIRDIFLRVEQQQAEKNNKE